jgi:hypothetical protein
MPRTRRTRRVEPTPTMMRLVELCEGEVDRRVGSDATFEQRQDARAALAAEVLYKAAEQDQAGNSMEVTHARQPAAPEGRPE